MTDSPKCPMCKEWAAPNSHCDRIAELERINAALLAACEKAASGLAYGPPRCQDISAELKAAISLAKEKP